MNIRVFLNPDGTRWVDIGYPDIGGMSVITTALVNDGFLMAQHAYIPRDSIHSILTLVPVGENGGAKLTVFPGGKPPEGAA